MISRWQETMLRDWANERKLTRSVWSSFPLKLKSESLLFIFASKRKSIQYRRQRLIFFPKKRKKNVKKSFTMLIDRKIQWNRRPMLFFIRLNHREERKIDRYFRFKMTLLVQLRQDCPMLIRKYLNINAKPLCKVNSRKCFLHFKSMDFDRLHFQTAANQSVSPQFLSSAPFF